MNQSNPYRVPGAEIADVTHGEEFELAGAGHRFGAFLIDTLIQVAICVPLYMTGKLDFALRGPDSWAASLSMAALGLAMFAVVHSWFLKRSGQTIGKKIVGIRIVDLAGNRPGLLRLLLRRYSLLWLVNALPGAWALLGLVDMLFIFRADRRCVHDLIAGTKVVMHGARHSSATWFVTPLVTLAVLGTAAAIVAPMFDGSRAKKTARRPAHAAAPAHPSTGHAATTPAAPAARTPTAPVTAAPAPAVHSGPGSQTAPHSATVPDSATHNPSSPATPVPAEPQPSEAELRKCLALKDPASIIRCSQGGK